MLLIGPRKDKDVVQVGHTKHVDQSGERFVHIGLEGCGGIRKPKWHDGVFEVSIPGSEGCFLTIVGVYAYAIVGVPQINLKKKIRVI